MDKRQRVKRRTEDAKRYSNYNQIEDYGKRKLPEMQSYRERMHKIAMYRPAALTYGRNSG